MNPPLPVRAYLRIIGYRVAACICPVLLASWLVWDLLCVPFRALLGKSVRSQLEECDE